MALRREMSDYPNAAGKSLKNGDANTILFNFSDFDRNFYLDNHLTESATMPRTMISNLMICPKKSCEKFMRSGLTSGCIVLDMEMKNDLLLDVASENYPIVLLDRYIESPFMKSIVVNSYTPMAEPVQGVIDRGYKRFAFVGGPENTDDNKGALKPGHLWMFWRVII